MKVGVNLLWLVPGEVGGSETWVTGLLGAVAADPPGDLDVTVFASRRVLDAHPFLDAFTAVTAPNLGGSRPARIAAEASWLAVAARRANVDVVHHPGGTVPPIRSGPSLLTIHDLQPLALPEHFSNRKRAYLRARLGPSARAAKLVSAVSTFTAGDIIHRLDVDPDKVVVTPAAVDPDPVPADVDEAAVARAYRLDGPWFLYPAITYPHKNHAVLLRGFAEVHRQRPDALLVLTGGNGGTDDDLVAEAERLGVAHRVRRTGRVPTAHLDRLYRGAVALAFPSRFEGVGLPVLEAMARSCAVVAADATGLPDVVADAGVLVDPDDAGAWGTALLRVLEDDDHRRALVDAGHQRVQAWAPPASAAALVDAWRRAGGGRP